MSAGPVSAPGSPAAVQPGDRLPDLRLTVDPVRMFAFSAATHNAHRIHYDLAWTRDEEGYPDLVVQGPLQTALMARQVTDWAGPEGRLVAVTMSNLAATHPGQLLTCGAEVLSVESDPLGRRIELSLTCSHEGKVLVRGTAVVLLHEASGTVC